MNQSLQSIRQTDIDHAISACLSGCAPTTRRAYAAQIARFRLWCLTSGGAGSGGGGSGGSGGLDRQTVSAWLDSLSSRGVGAVALNQALSAVKRLAAEAAALGWLPYETQVQIAGIRSRRRRGIRTGTWLSLAQCRELLAAPDRETMTGKRDAAVLALLLGCGLRRAEACSLYIGQYRQAADGTMTLQNVEGKGNRLRTVTVPDWAAKEIDTWVLAAGVTEGKLLRGLKGETAQ